MFSPLKVASIKYPLVPAVTKALTVESIASKLAPLCIERSISLLDVLIAAPIA